MEFWYTVIALLLITLAAVTRRRRPLPTHRARHAPERMPSPPRRRATYNELAAVAYWTSAAIAWAVRTGHQVRDAARDAWQHYGPASPLMSRPAEQPSEKPALQPAETLRNAAETPETPPVTPSVVAVSDIMADDRVVDAMSIDTEQVKIDTIAKLLKAKVITSETRALETAFEVKAGGGKEYQRLRALLKDALGETEVEQPSAAFAQSVPSSDAEQRLAKAA